MPVCSAELAETLSLSGHFHGVSPPDVPFSRAWVFSQVAAGIEEGFWDRPFYPWPIIFPHESLKGTMRLKTSFPEEDSFASRQK